MDRISIAVPAANAHITHATYNELLWVAHQKSRRQVTLMAQLFEKQSEVEAKIKRDEIAIITREMTELMYAAGINSVEGLQAFALNMLDYKFADPNPSITAEQARALMTTGAAGKLIRGECD